MICAIVPAKNESGRILTVLQNLALLPIDHIILITNGCRDSTVYQSLQLRIPKLQLIYFYEPLGIDIPRSIGAKIAQSLGCDAAIFVDGDMVGTFGKNLIELIDAIVIDKVDMALTNCYPLPPRHIEKCNPTFKWRAQLNETLGLENQLQLANPSHGPHAISKKLLNTISLQEFSIPPVTLSLAKIHNLKISTGTTIPHYLLGSSVKGNTHANKIIDTIVGDCLEAISVYEGRSRTRQWQNKSYLGYHAERRFDILDEFLTPI